MFFTQPNSLKNYDSSQRCPKADILFQHVGAFTILDFYCTVSTSATIHDFTRKFEYLYATRVSIFWYIIITSLVEIDWISLTICQNSSGQST